MRIVKFIPVAALCLFTNAQAQGGEVRFFGVITNPTCAIHGTYVDKQIAIICNLADETSVKRPNSIKTALAGLPLAKTTVVTKKQEGRPVGAVLTAEYR